MKKFFTKTLNVVKVFSFLIIVAVAFYSGMYVTSYNVNNDEPIEIMQTAINNAFADTSNRPIIVITPQRSMYERAMLKVGMKVKEPETIHLTTYGDTNLLVDAASYVAPEIDKATMAKVTGSRWLLDAHAWGKTQWSKWSKLVTFVD